MLFRSLAAAVGGKLLKLVGGADFSSGGKVLIPLTIAASFELASVAFEPVLHSTGLARYALLARAAAAVALGAALLVLDGYGASGIAWAVAIAGAVSYLALGGFAAIVRPATPASSNP